jgi:hypothetical protein
MAFGALASGGISSHPYSNPYLGGQLASDLPPESLGRAEIEPLLRPRATRHRQLRRPGTRDAAPSSATADLNAAKRPNSSRRRPGAPIPPISTRAGQ